MLGCDTSFTLAALNPGKTWTDSKSVFPLTDDPLAGHMGKAI